MKKIDVDIPLAQDWRAVEVLLLRPVPLRPIVTVRLKRAGTDETSGSRLDLGKRMFLDALPVAVGRDDVRSFAEAVHRLIDERLASDVPHRAAGG